MKKLRFKNRRGILYFGIGDKLKSSKMKYNAVNKNIILGKFNRGEIDDELLLVKQQSSRLIDLVTQVLKDKNKHLRYKTMLNYHSSVATHIKPYFKEKMVTEVKPINIKEFQDHLVNKGLGKSSIQIARLLLKEAFELAVLNEFVQSNPIVSVSIPKLNKEKKKQKPFTLDEIDLILDSVSGHFRNFLGILFFTGMRSGELLALKWEDVDFITETISINKTIAKGFINKPKTHSSERDIEMLDQVKEFFKSQQLETGIKNSYIFLNEKNTFHSTNSRYYLQFQKLLKQLNLEQRALHNTRHTFASIMLNNRIDPLWVSNTLGHENLQITLDTYTHYMPKKEKMTIGFLEKRYKNGTNT